MEWLEGELTTMAICWRIERRDGVAIGLTAHDQDLTIGGLIYRAAPGMVPSAIVRGDAAQGNGMQATGSLTSEGISETDLQAGRWDGAEVEVFAVDWCDPAQPLSLGRGRFGSVETSGHGFAAELRGGLMALDAPVSERTSPDCRAELGGRRCRAAMAGRRHWARVIAINGRDVTLDQAEPLANAYGEGRLCWFGGRNSGLDDAILKSTGDVVTLRRHPRFTDTGVLVRIEQGCDKRLQTCANRFSNAANFRGEPYLPGIDLLTRYPGA